jgi:hypothetical protein
VMSSVSASRPGMSVRVDADAMVAVRLIITRHMSASAPSLLLFCNLATPVDEQYEPHT